MVFDPSALIGDANVNYTADRRPRQHLATTFLSPSNPARARHRSSL